MATRDPNEYDPFEEPIGFAAADYYVAPTAPSSSNFVDFDTSAGYGSGLFGSVKITPEALDATAGRDLEISALRYGEPLGYVFGNTTVVPKIITVHNDGEVLYVDYFISVGECQEIVGVSRNGVDIGKPTDWEYFLGTSSQTASTLLSGVLGSTYDSLSGICHVVAKLAVDDPIDCRFEVKGLKLYDPRTSPNTAYSTNPALALARMLTDCGYTVSDSSLTTAANYCDEDVSGASRWTFNMQCADRKNISTWVSALSAYCSCFVDYQGNEVVLIPDADVATSPVTSKAITAADMVEGSVKTEIDGARQTPDQVTVMYRELDGTQRTAVAGTGTVGARSRLSMPGIQTYSEARRKAEETLAKSALDLTHEHIAHDTALGDTVGDLMSITYAPHGLSNKVFRLVGMEEVTRGRWRRKFREYGATTNDSTETEPPVIVVDPPNPDDVPDGPTPVLSEVLRTNSFTGTKYTVLKGQFSCVDWPYAEQYRVRIYDGNFQISAQLIDHVAGTSPIFYTTQALRYGATYNVYIWVVSKTGKLSATPGFASLTPSTSTSAELDAGDLTNMHTYILDGDSKYATTSEKNAGVGQSWADRFTESPYGDAWTTDERWLENQTCETVFQTEEWNTGNYWDGLWKWVAFEQVTELGGATSGNSVLLSLNTSPLSFTEYSGLSYSAKSQVMKAKCVVTDSPLVAGYGLHVKLPIPATFILGG